MNNIENTAGSWPGRGARSLRGAVIGFLFANVVNGVLGSEQPRDDKPIAYQQTRAQVPKPHYISNAASIQLPGPASSTALNSHISAKGRYISWKEHLIDDATISGIRDMSGGDGLKAADLDLDGYLDIVSVHEGDVAYDGVARGLVRIAFGTQDPDAWDLVTLANGAEAGAAEDVAIADMTGDGYPDIVVACELAHLIFFANPGLGKNIRNTTWKRVIPPATVDRGSWIRVFFGDFNSDGKLEVVAANKGSQSGKTVPEHKEISLFDITGDPLNGQNWIEHVLAKVSVPENCRPVDLNGDGLLDILGAYRGGEGIFWLENTGTGHFVFEKHPIFVGDGSESIPVRGVMLDFADLNKDGRLDIVLMDGNPRSNVIWLEQPSGVESKSATWNLHKIGTVSPDSLISIQLADINGSGDMDVIVGTYSGAPRDHDGANVTRNSRLGRIAWFENAGDLGTKWTRHDISRRKRGMYDQFVPVDLNEDGAVDFVATRGNTHPNDGVFWLEQVRTHEPVQRFTPARDPRNESEEMPLPNEQDAAPAG